MQQEGYERDWLVDVWGQSNLLALYLEANFSIQWDGYWAFTNLVFHNLLKGARLRSLVPQDYDGTAVTSRVYCLGIRVQNEMKLEESRPFDWGTREVPPEGMELYLELLDVRVTLPKDTFLTVLASWPWTVLNGKYHSENDLWSGSHSTFLFTVIHPLWAFKKATQQDKTYNITPERVSRGQRHKLS